MRSNSTFAGSLALVFLAAGLVGIVNHEMWRDELQAWLIARDSSSIGNLFDNSKYEGHPRLWHLILYVITRVTSEPAAMQLFHVMLATATIYIVARFSPFTTAQKVLFSFGYFPFYEYAIISRNYALGILCMFAFCALFPTRTRRYLFLSGILFLLAQTSIYGVMIAIAMALTLVSERLLDTEITRISSVKRWDVAVSLLVFTLGIASAIYQILPPKDTGFVRGLARTFHTSWLGVTLTTIWKAYVPLPDLFSYHFWNTNVLASGPSGLRADLPAVLSVGLLALSVGLLAGKPVALFLYLSGTLGILTFTYVWWFGKVVHHGHLFMLLLASVWISSYYAETRVPFRFLEQVADVTRRVGSGFLLLLLCVHLAAAIVAFSLDYSYPFSASKEASRFIQARHLADMPIVGYRDAAVSPLSAYLRRNIYYPESERSGSFIIWDKKRKMISPGKLLDQLSDLTEERDTEILLILNYRLRADVHHLRLSELSTFDKSIIADEKYYLYLVQRKDL